VKNAAATGSVFSCARDEDGAGKVKSAASAPRDIMATTARLVAANTRYHAARKRRLASGPKRVSAVWASALSMSVLCPGSRVGSGDETNTIFRAPRVGRHLAVSRSALYDRYAYLMSLKILFPKIDRRLDADTVEVGFEPSYVMR
jgi:hypothetical protein